MPVPKKALTLKLNLPAYTADDAVDLPCVPSTLSLNSNVNVEPIGYWFHLAQALKRDVASGTYFGTNKDANAKRAKADADDEETEARSHKRGVASDKFTKLTDEEKEVDWYAFLKLGNAEASTEQEIKQAYRRRCLETHPDKQPNRSDAEFKKVQRAFEILGDPNSRRAFDSSRPFDDTIPDEDLEMDEETFFNTFNPAFARNRKWSVDTRIPFKLGDANTPLKDIKRFYDAWYRFNSWRDFSNEADIEDISENMCREEKRYYQRENQRVLDRHNKAEQKRIRTLLENAQRSDPRLRKIREAEAAAREKEKAERIAEKERIRNEEIARKAAIVEKERAAKQAVLDKIQAEKDAIKKCEMDMLTFFTNNTLIEDVSTNLFQTFAVRPPNVAWLYSKISKLEEAEETLKAVTTESTTLNEADKTVPAVTAFNHIVTAKEQSTGMTRYGEAIKKLTPEDIAARRKAEEEKKAEVARKAASGTVWTDDDLNVLQKAIAKYPGGTIDRWRKMAQMLHDKFTEDEVLHKTKDLEAKLRSGIQGPQVLHSSVAPSASAANAATVTAADPASDVWSPEQQKQLETGLRELKDYKEKDKYQKVAKFVTGKTAKQCFDRYKYLVALNKK